jgi:hypothetical protein
MAWEIVQEIPGESLEFPAPRPGLRGLGGHDMYLLPGENHSRIFKSIEWIITYVIAPFFTVVMDLYVFVK